MSSNKSISIRLSDAELAILDEKVEKSGLQRSDYCRRVLLSNDKAAFHKYLSPLANAFWGLDRAEDPEEKQNYREMFADLLWWILEEEYYREEGGACNGNLGD